MSGLIKRQLDNAESVINEVKPLLKQSGGDANDLALAILTAGILVAAQLENLASNVDCDKIADAIKGLEK